MFKRAGIILLVLLYTITVTGFALNLHYCGNTVAEVKINAPAKTCAAPMVMGKMNCCKDSHLTVKVKDGHQSGSQLVLAKIYAFNLPGFINNRFTLSLPTVAVSKTAGRGPPDIPIGNVAVFVKNCIFRI